LWRVKKLLETGVKYAVIKKGAHGAALFFEGGIFQLPAFPLKNVVDPTGAGDSFIGAMMGFLGSQENTGLPEIKKGMAYGTVAAAYNVEAFSLDNLKNISRENLDTRYQALLKTTQYD